MVLATPTAFPADQQSAALDELKACRSAVPASTDKPFDSPCGFKTDIRPLKGIALDRLLSALGKPDVCYTAAGGLHMPKKDSRCVRGFATGWSFFRLPFGSMGGGPYFLCRLDLKDRCSLPFWLGTM